MIPTQETLQKAVEIVQQIERLRSEMVALFGEVTVASPSTAPRAVAKAPRAARAAKAAAPADKPEKKGRNMTAAGRARIAAAARARWARFHAARKAASR